MKKSIVWSILIFISFGNVFAQTEKSFENYEKFDFIPCEKIIYVNDFMQDTLDKFPQKWITNSPSEVVKLKEYPGRWFRLNLGSTNSTDGKIVFEENTTIEFDMIANTGGVNNDNSEIQVYFHSQLPDEIFGDYVPGSGGFCFKFIGQKISAFNWKNQDYSDVNNEYSSDEVALIKNKKIHISIAIQKNNVRLYVNQFKVVDIPNLLPEGIPPMDRISFYYNGINLKFSLLISNLIIQTGLSDNKTKMTKYGRVSTNGIKFDVGLDTIKSESYPVMKEIAGIINDTRDTKFKIICHTDNEGDASVNLALSKKRAAAIKKTLEEVFEVDSKILIEEGKGESSPLNKNLTNEEKATNRRIEFIKL
jgi:OmpA-OmpF porin, OOP family